MYGCLQIVKGHASAPGRLTSAHPHAAAPTRDASRPMPAAAAAKSVPA
jgi:hypothetical protein